MRSMWPAARGCANPAELHVLLLQPLEHFDVIAAVPYMLDLRRRPASKMLAVLLRGQAFRGVMRDTFWIDKHAERERVAAPPSRIQRPGDGL